MTTHERPVDRRRSPGLDQKKLRLIVERMADGILVVDLDGVICFANPAAEQLFARPARELVGTPIGLPAVNGESTEIDVIRPDGETVAVELRVVDTEWEEKPARLASLRDVTDRRRAEERSAQLERERLARAEAEAGSQAKSEFLAMMSHELRTPLNAMIGYADLLDMGIAGSVTENQREQIGRIRTSGRHLLGLVNEVLDLAKVEAGRLTITPGTASAARTVNAALALAEPAAEGRAIVVTASRRGDKEVLYEADEERVRQVLLNLVTNAVKFTPPGGRVSIEHGMEGTRVYFRVTDTGIGIPADQISRIFDPFVQVHAGHARPRDGSGLGLAISRRLARLMQGDVTVESEPGRGSTFTLWLPAATPADRESPAEPAIAIAGDDRVRGLGQIGTALERERKGVVDAFAARLRTERIAAHVESLRYAQLVDHLGAYLATVASLLMAIEDAHGHTSSLVADGAEILRVIAERHGAQRARLGWTSKALQREWQIVLEEINRVVQRPEYAVSDRARAEASVIVERFLQQAEQLSVRSLTRSLQTDS